jgi:hypothetical protein
MDADERAICMYLKSCPGQWLSGAEIARRADGKRRFRKDPMWAAPVIMRLVDQSWLESDSTGHYRLRALGNRGKPKKWISPRYRRILEESGKFEGTINIPEDDYPDFTDATQLPERQCLSGKK